MENNLHINERLEKQKVAEFFAQRGTVPADDKEKQVELVNGMINELVMNTTYIAPVTISGEGDSRQLSFKMVKNPQGEQYFPIFTSSEDLEQWEDVKDSDTVQLPFDNFAVMLNNNSKIGGVAINPFSDNFRVDRRVVAQWYERKQLLVQGHANHTITKDSKYELYAPSPYPFEISEKLAETAKDVPEVKRLWLRGIKLDGKDGYLVVVELSEGDRQKLIPVLGEAVRDLLNGGVIHFVAYGSEFADQAVENVVPIYARND